MRHRRHELNSTTTCLLMINTTHYGFIEILSLYEKRTGKIKGSYWGTTVLVSQVVKYSYVPSSSEPPSVHDTFTQLLPFLMWPRRQQAENNSKQKQAFISSWDTISFTVSLHTRALFLTKCQPKLRYGHLLFEQPNGLIKYNLCSGHSFGLARSHLSSAALHVSEEEAGEKRAVNSSPSGRRFRSTGWLTLPSHDGV